MELEGHKLQWERRAQTPEKWSRMTKAPMLLKKQLDMVVRAPRPGLR